MRTLLFTLLFLAVVFFALPLAYPLGSSPKNYLTAIDRKMELQEKVASPRILLIGGSNLVFGVDGERLSKVLGVPVMNLAVHADLGVPFMCAQAEAAIRPGDIALFSYEYHCRQANLRTAALASLESPRTATYFPFGFSDRLRLATLRSQIVLAGLVNVNLFGQYTYTRIYRADGFNAYGDLLTHLHTPRDPLWLEPPVDTLLAEVQPSMDRLLRTAKSRGAQAVYLPPSYPEKAYRLYGPAIEQIGAKMRARGWPQLCANRQMIFADSLIFDSPNHLNAQGQAARTEIILKALRPYASGLKKQSGAATL